MLNATRGTLVRHGVARLWWVAARPTIQARAPISQATDDAFAYTRAVLRNEDRVNALFDREAGAIPALVRQVLEHIDAAPGRGADSYMRDLMKEVTLVYGYRDIGSLDDQQIRAVVDAAAPS